MDRKMNILFVAPFFYPAVYFGGPVTNTLELAKRLTEIGHKVTVYCSNRLDKTTNMNIGIDKLNENLEVHYFKNKIRFLGFAITPDMIKALKENAKNFDIIHVHGFRNYQDFIAYRILSKKGIPYIMTSREAVLPRGKAKTLKKIYDIFFGKKIIQSAKRVISVSEMLATEYLKMGVDPNKILVIPNGVEIPTTDKKGYLREKFGLKENDKIFLFLGRIRWSKGIEILIRAFHDVKKPDIHLVIVGPDYGFLSNCKELVKKLGISKNVHFMDFANAEQKALLFSDSYVLVQPSFYETFGSVILEAAAAKLPSINTETCGLATEISKANAGWIVKTGDSKDLAKAISEAVEKPNLVKIMSENALTLTKKYDWEKIVKSHLDVYHEVLNANQKSIV